jgi:hypothetical protein
VQYVEQKSTNRREKFCTIKQTATGKKKEEEEEEPKRKQTVDHP